MRFHCLRLPLWASACVDPHGCPAFSRVGAGPSPWVPLLLPGCEGSLPPCSFSSCLPSGCGHPLGSLVSFVTIDRHRRFPLREFLLGGSLPFRSGVVVSLRPLCLSWLLVAGDSAFP